MGDGAGSSDVDAGGLDFAFRHDVEIHMLMGPLESKPVYFPHHHLF